MVTEPHANQPVEMRIEVCIYEENVLVHAGWFDNLEAAEAFAEEWTERVPGARAEFEELAGHALNEIVEQDTALAEDYPHA